MSVENPVCPVIGYTSKPIIMMSRDYILYVNTV